MAVFTIVLPVLLGVMALGVDFALIYFNWSMVQKAADAAALAGASQLTGVAGSASTVQPAVVNYVNGYACMNGISDPAATYPTLCTETTHPGGFVDKIVFTNVTDTEVSVGIKRTVPYYFGKLIGLNTANVAAKATAAVDPIGTVTSGLFPVGIQCNSPCSTVNLDPGQVTSFGSKFVGGLAPGNWDWLDLGQGKGASALGSAIQNGASGSFSISEDVGSAPGNKGNSGPVKKGLNARLSSCATTTAATVHWSAARMASVERAGFRAMTRAWLPCPRLTSLDATAGVAACRSKLLHRSTWSKTVPGPISRAALFGHLAPAL